MDKSNLQLLEKNQNDVLSWKMKIKTYNVFYLKIKYKNFLFLKDTITDLKR